MLGDKIRGLWNEYLFERFTDAALDDLGDEADLLESDLENAQLTLREDLRYQEKLENRLERVRVLSTDPTGILSTHELRSVLED